MNKADGSPEKRKRLKNRLNRIMEAGRKRGTDRMKRTLKCTEIPDGHPRKAFITGPILMVLLLCMILCLSLGEALSYAVSGTRYKMDHLKASLAYEETILRIDLGLPTDPFSLGTFTVEIEELSDAEGIPEIRLRLMDGSEILEEAWLEKEE